MQSDLLTGWGPHYAQGGDISMQRSGDHPEVLQMHSGFIQAAGLTQRGEGVTSEVAGWTHRRCETQLTDLI